MKKITKYVLLTSTLLATSVLATGCIDKSDPSYITFEVAQNSGYSGTYSTWKKAYENKDLEFRLVDGDMEYKIAEWNFMYESTSSNPSWFTSIVDGELGFDCESYYSVNFESNCDTVVERQVVKPGDKAVEPSAITKDDHIFIDWMNGTSPYDFDTEVNSRVDLTASWYIDGIIFTGLTYDSTTGEYSLNVANSESTLDFTNYLQTQTHYTVNGSSSTTVNLNEGDNTFTIVNSEENSNGEDTFVINVYRNHMYTVTFDYEFDTKENTTETVNVEEGNKVTSPNLVVDGYTYIVSFDFDDEITKDETITVVYSANNYSITFDVDGGNSLDVQYALFNTNTILPTPTKDRHVFLGWYDEDSNLMDEEFTFDYTSNITLTAKWQQNEFYINYDANGGVLPDDNPTGYDKGTDELTLNAPTRTGYTFIGWYMGETLYTSVAANSEIDLDLVAKWEANEYDVTFDVDGGDSLSDVTVTFDSEYTLPAATKTDFVFNGWLDSDDNKVNLAGIWDIANNTTLKADWIVCDNTVSYVLNGGINNPNNPYGFDNGDVLTLNDATRVGYTFNGWFYDEELTSKFDNSVSDDITLYASFEANTYNVTFDVNGGLSIRNTSITVTYDKAFDLEVTSKFGYTFIGWEVNGVLVTSELWNIDGNVELVAKYEEADFSITYVTTGTNVISNAQGFNDGEEVLLVDPADVDGYTFVGWFYDESFTEEFDNSKYSDITLYAKYDANEYTISFDVSYGDAIDDLTVTFNEDYTLTDAVFNGFTFITWELDGVEFTDGTWTLLTDIELVAVWNIITYEITYELTDGDNSELNVFEYTWEDEIILYDATRQLDKFDGWLFGTDKIAKIEQGSYGDVHLVATFTEAVFNLSFEYNDGDIVSNIAIYSLYDGEKLLNRSAKEGYFFSYWSIDEDGVVDATIWNQDLLRLLDTTEVVLYAIFTNDPMQNIIFTDVDYLGNENTYIYFGYFPQTAVTDSELVSTLSTIHARNELGYLEYDGDQYLRLTMASIYHSSYKFNDGTQAYNTEYYFKVEPIKWNIYFEEDGNIQVVSEYILDNFEFNQSTQDVVLNEITYYANNYENSDVREYLNDYFYNLAFDSSQQDSIATTLVLNSEVSTYGYKNSDGEYESHSINNEDYLSNDTLDKLYLLSFDDVLNTDYGFADTIDNSTTRSAKVSDYALARGVRLSDTTNNLGFWWTRTGMHSSSEVLYIGSGSQMSYGTVNSIQNGIRPAFIFA